MIEEIIDANYIQKAKNKKKIQTNNDLRKELGLLLDYFERDLPEKLYGTRASRIPKDKHFIKNFSQSEIFRKEIRYLSHELFETFNFNYELEIEKIIQTEIQFNPKNIPNNLENNQSEEKIEQINQNIPAVADSSILSSKKDMKIDRPESSILDSESYFDVENNFEKQSEIESVRNVDSHFSSMNFSSSQEKPDFVENTGKPIETTLDETLELLGMGSLKRKFKKQIISEKKDGGVSLSFDEWLRENKLWVRLLLLSLNNLDYIDTTIEMRLIQKTRQYLLSKSNDNAVLDKQLHDLFQKLNLN